MKRIISDYTHEILADGVTNQDKFNFFKKYLYKPSDQLSGLDYRTINFKKEFVEAEQLLQRKIDEYSNKKESFFTDLDPMNGKLIAREYINTIPVETFSYLTLYPPTPKIKKVRLIKKILKPISRLKKKFLKNKN